MIVRTPHLAPDDPHNRALVELVRPLSWKNPEPLARYDIVVVGGGLAGITAAEEAVALGARTALVERDHMGGNALVTGGVPAIALLASARTIARVREASMLGVDASLGAIDFAKLMERVREVRRVVAERASVERLAGLGIHVFLGEGRFASGNVLVVDRVRLRFERALVTTGSRPARLHLPGLKDASPLSIESIFGLTELPPRLIVVGAGETACELAQAFRRFGSEVTIVSDEPRLLAGEDEAAAKLIEERFRAEKIGVVVGAKLRRVTQEGGKRLHFETDEKSSVVADEILIAAGRSANLEGLNLPAADVGFDVLGIHVDDYLRTSNTRIWAAGDVCSRYQYNHASAAMGRCAVENALGFGRGDATSSLVIPRVVLTDPEVAHVGLVPEEAADRGHAVVTLEDDFAARALVEGEPRGRARLHVDAATGKILGATLVARGARDAIAPVALAMTAGLGADVLGSSVPPAASLAEVWKRLADAWRRSHPPRRRALAQRFLSLRNWLDEVRADWRARRRRAGMLSVLRRKGQVEDAKSDARAA